MGTAELWCSAASLALVVLGWLCARAYLNSDWIYGCGGRTPDGFSGPLTGYHLACLTHPDSLPGAVALARLQRRGCTVLRDHKVFAQRRDVEGLDAFESRALELVEGQRAIDLAMQLSAEFRPLLERDLESTGLLRPNTLLSPLQVTSGLAWAIWVVLGFTATLLAGPFGWLIAACGVPLVFSGRLRGTASNTRISEDGRVYVESLRRSFHWNAWRLNWDDASIDEIGASVALGLLAPSLGAADPEWPPSSAFSAPRPWVDPEVPLVLRNAARARAETRARVVLLTLGLGAVLISAVATIVFLSQPTMVNWGPLQRVFTAGYLLATLWGTLLNLRWRRDGQLHQTCWFDRFV